MSVREKERIGNSAANGREHTRPHREEERETLNGTHSFVLSAKQQTWINISDKNGGGGGSNNNNKYDDGIPKWFIPIPKHTVVRSLQRLLQRQRQRWRHTQTLSNKIAMALKKCIALCYRRSVVIVVVVALLLILNALPAGHIEWERENQLHNK